MKNNKIKILYQLNQLGYSGTEKAIYTFIKNLNKEKYSVSVFFYTDKGSFNFYRKKFLSFFIKRYKTSYIQKYIIGFARKEEFENLIGIENFYMGDKNKFFTVCNKLDLDIIHFSRGIEEDFYTNSINNLPNDVKIVETSIFGKPSNSNYLNRLSSIFFVSKWLMNQAKWVDQSKGKVLYLPIPKPITKESFRKRYSIPNDAIILGRISRPYLDDGEFIYEVLNNIIKTNIFYIGIGSSDNLIEKTKNNKNIIHINPTTDEVELSTFYTTIDILLHYRIEGETFGMNIADAMIHGKPVVSHYSSVDNAQAELILGDKNAGIVVRDNNLSEYVNAIQLLIDNSSLRIEYGQNAQEKANALYSEDKATKILESYYTKIINKKV